MAGANILALPFRRTHPVSLSDALRRYVSKKYDQHPEMFAQDFEAIDRLRAEAVTTLEAHASGIQKIAAYAAQLVWIGGKFPIDVGTEFTWYPCLGFNKDTPVSEDNLRFDLANVVFNLAALYSQLALSLNRSAEDGLKAASSYFCHAAGVLEYLKSDVIPDMRSNPPEDMDTMTLESLQKLMLAQAQECSWAMAVKRGYKDNLISKLAAKVSDFYDQAAECGTRSEAVSTSWIHHMSAKHHHYAGAAQYRAACDCLEKRLYGEEIARFRDSLACVNEGLKESKWIGKAVIDDLSRLKLKVTEDLKRAEKDNDMIYLHNVPSKSELRTLDRANMAVEKKPTEISDPSTSLGEKGKLGKPLFTRLVPHAVHVAASIYADRRDRIISSGIIDELEALTLKLHELLQSLNLPGSLQAMEKPLGIPPSLASHVEEIRQLGGVHRLRRSLRETESVKENDVNAYKEGVSFLQTESAEDERARSKHGTEYWTRPPSNQAAENLYKQASDIDGYLKSAQSSDELIKNKLVDCEAVLRVLEGSDRQLEEYVPSSRKSSMPPKLEKEASRLRALLNEISRLEGRRKRRAEILREKGKSDDISAALQNEAARIEREFPMQKIEAIQFEDLFEKRLQTYDDDKMMVSEESEEQDHITRQLIETNGAFQSARRGDTSDKDRELALQKLENGYLKFKEILGNVDTGRKFYNELAAIVNRFRDDCREFRYQRHMDASQTETELSNAMSALSVARKNALQDQKEREILRPQYEAKSSSSSSLLSGGPPNPNEQTPMTAPTPTRAPVAPPPATTSSVWSPNMGIKFAGTAAAPPPAHSAAAGGSGSGGNAHNPPYPNTRLGGRWSPSKGMKFS